MLDKSKLPTPDQYFGQFEGVITGGKSLRLPCPLHGGKGPNLSVDRETGVWHCFTCHAKGGDVVAFEQQLHGIGFVRAASNFGAYIPDGKPSTPATPALNYRALLNVLAFEVEVAALITSDVAAGREPSKQDVSRLIQSAGRINKVAEVLR
jgi:hypothetical protein